MIPFGNFKTTCKYEVNDGRLNLQALWLSSLGGGVLIFGQSLGVWTSCRQFWSLAVCRAGNFTDCAHPLA